MHFIHEDSINIVLLFKKYLEFKKIPKIGIIQKGKYYLKIKQGTPLYELKNWATPALMTTWTPVYTLHSAGLLHRRLAVFAQPSVASLCLGFRLATGCAFIGRLACLSWIMTNTRARLGGERVLGFRPSSFVFVHNQPEANVTCPCDVAVVFVMLITVAP